MGNHLAGGGRGFWQSSPVGSRRLRPPVSLYRQQQRDPLVAAPFICFFFFFFFCHRHGNASSTSVFVWALQASIQMSPSTISHLCLLALPVMSLLLLFSPIGRSHDSRSLTPGCHLHRKWQLSITPLFLGCDLFPPLGGALSPRK